jgi:hypothetical protein
LLARTRYEYARMLLARGQAADGSRALRLLEEALATASTLGMAAVVEGIQTLQAARAGGPSQLGTGAEAVAPEVGRNVFRLEGEYWTVSYEGAVVRLKDTKGLRHLARLLAHPGREFHATDLEAAQGQAAQAGPVGPRGRPEGGGLAVRPDLGDAGRCWTPPPRPPTRPAWTSSTRSWRRRRAATTLSVPPTPEQSETSWWGSWRGRWGWAAQKGSAGTGDG